MDNNNLPKNEMSFRELLKALADSKEKHVPIEETFEEKLLSNIRFRAKGGNYTLKVEKWFRRWFNDSYEVIEQYRDFAQKYSLDIEVKKKTRNGRL